MLCNLPFFALSCLHLLLLYSRQNPKENLPRKLSEKKLVFGEKGGGDGIKV